MGSFLVVSGFCKYRRLSRLAHRVLGVPKGKKGHWDRAKMGAGVHFNFALLLPCGGRTLTVVMEGGRRSPGFWLTR